MEVDILVKSAFSPDLRADFNALHRSKGVRPSQIHLDFEKCTKQFMSWFRRLVEQAPESCDYASIVVRLYERPSWYE